MTKLIEAFKANPTPRNRERLQDYIRRHPMAIVLCSSEQMDFIRSNNFSF
jgi:hypothetical protein